jgi:hypothetical protein
MVVSGKGHRLTVYYIVYAHFSLRETYELGNIKRQLGNISPVPVLPFKTVTIEHKQY